MLIDINESIIEEGYIAEEITVEQAIKCLDDSVDLCKLFCLGNFINTPQQHEALFNLLRLANVFDSDISLSSLTSSKEIYNKLNKAPIKHALDWFIKETQEKFFIRKDKERWDVKIPDWVINNKESASYWTQKLNMCDPILPIDYNYYALAILGATGIEMKKRFEWAHDLINIKTILIDKIYLLAGERYIETDESGLDRDGGRGFLESIAAKYNHSLQKVTETEIARELAENIFSKLNSDIKIITLHSEQSNGKRPTTESNARVLLRELESHASREDIKILVISRAPNIFPQKQQFLPIIKDSNIKFEFVGGPCSFNEGSLEYNIMNILMPVAGTFYQAANQLRGKMANNSNLINKKEDL